MMRYVLCACFAVAVLAPLTGADEKDDKAIAEATKKLQGTWAPAGMEFDGKKLDPSVKTTARFTYKDDEWRLEIDGKVVSEGTWKIVAVKDKLFHFNQPTKSKDATALQLLQITDEDTFRLCFTGMALKTNEKRPEKFTAEAGSNQTIITYKRVKK